VIASRQKTVDGENADVNRQIKGLALKAVQSDEAYTPKRAGKSRGSRRVIRTGRRRIRLLL